MHAPRRNLLTSLIINYDVGHDGRARDIEIDNNIGMDHIALKGALEQEALKQYRPANKLKNKKLKVRSFGHRNVWAQRSINENSIKDRLPKFYKKVKKLRVNADKGNANAQYQLAMLILAFPALEINTMSYIKYIEMAAKAGIPEAEAEFSQLLLTGKKIKKDLDQGISYLLSAAQSGYARAQYKLARQFLSGRIIQKNEHKAQFWLEQSETQDEMYAKFWLARLSLTSEDQALRNPELAKQLLANVARQERNNPNWYYFSALAQLQLGDKKQGRSLLTDGIELAEEYSWDLSEFEQLSEQLKVKSDV
jgi:TPR repeat protein